MGISLESMLDRAKKEGYGVDFLRHLANCKIKHQDELSLSVEAPDSMDEASGHWLVRELAYLSGLKSVLFQSKDFGFRLCDEDPQFPNGKLYAKE